VKIVALIVEDDSDTREVVRSLLDEQDYDTVGASTVAETMRRLAMRGIDVMVLDLGLPDGSGEEILVQMISRDIQVPVASPAAPGVARSYALMCIRKPFDLELLLTAVGVAIDRKMYPRRFA
jgi:two-component system, OmpR family, KDP operon response regulator KdpE